MLLNGKTPVIGLTLRHDRIDNFWFTLLHELAHLVEHYQVLSSTDHVFFDELDIETDDEIEAQADRLAKNSLVPSKFAKICKKVCADGGSRRSKRTSGCPRINRCWLLAERER